MEIDRVLLEAMGVHARAAAATGQLAMSEHAVSKAADASVGPLGTDPPIGMIALVPTPNSTPRSANVRLGLYSSHIHTRLVRSLRWPAAGRGRLSSPWTSYYRPGKTPPGPP